jgi:hypothetical protein
MQKVSFWFKIFSTTFPQDCSSGNMAIKHMSLLYAGYPFPQEKAGADQSTPQCLPPAYFFLDIHLFNTYNK